MWHYNTTYRKWAPLHEAAESGDVDKVRKLIEGGRYSVDCVDGNGWTPLHKAASRGHVDVVRVLVSEFSANANACTGNGDTPLHLAASSGHLDVVRVFVSDSKADVNACAQSGETPLHLASYRGHLDVVRVLVSEFSANANACTSNGDTPLHLAASSGHLDVVRVFVSEFKADVNVQNNGGDTSFDLAVFNTNSCEEVAVALMNEFHCDTKWGSLYIIMACKRNWVNLVRALVQKHGTGILKYTAGGTTLLRDIVRYSRYELAVMLVKEFGTSVRDLEGQSLLHIACQGGNFSLIRLISKHFPSTVWMVDDNGDTPLHVCAHHCQTGCVKALLEFDPPVMVRNNLGQTPKDVAEKYVDSLWNAESCKYIDAYIKQNKDKIHSHYELVQKHAKKKYSLPEPISRAFVLGNPGAGKSSLVEALKREGFFDSLWRVSSVPLHTAGIVPSIHTSKHYGRVLFYDFAGDAEYYSSHAAILENLASSRKGDNVFLLVIDMREEMAEIKKVFHYWLLFIQHQQFHEQKPRLIVVGSHLDLLTEDMAKARGKEFQMFYDGIDTEAVQMSALFMLDCCKPRSKQITDFQSLMSRVTKDSPSFELSFQASILLGLLEKDFSNVPACSIQTLLTHIEETGIELPTNTQLFYPILLELHDLGLLFLIDNSNRESSSVVLNMSQLTNKVHESLFSKKAILKTRFEERGLSFGGHYSLDWTTGLDYWTDL